MILKINGQPIPMTQGVPEKPGRYVVYYVSVMVPKIYQVTAEDIERAKNIGDRSAWTSHDRIRSVDPIEIEFKVDG